MSIFRMKRINEQVKRELSDLIRKFLPIENHGLITVTDVNVTKDLKNANVYISTVNVGPGNQSVLSSLEKIRKTLQHELSRKIVMKYTPHLAFKSDQGLERGLHIVKILDELDKSPTEK